MTIYGLAAVDKSALMKVKNGTQQNHITKSQTDFGLILEGIGVIPTRKISDKTVRHVTTESIMGEKHKNKLRVAVSSYFPTSRHDKRLVHQMGIAKNGQTTKATQFNSFVDAQNWVKQLPKDFLLVSYIICAERSSLPPPSFLVSLMDAASGDGMTNKREREPVISPEQFQESSKKSKADVPTYEMSINSDTPWDKRLPSFTDYSFRPISEIDDFLSSQTGDGDNENLLESFNDLFPLPPDPWEGALLHRSKKPLDY